MWDLHKLVQELCITSATSISYATLSVFQYFLFSLVTADNSVLEFI